MKYLFIILFIIQCSFVKDRFFFVCFFCEQPSDISKVVFIVDATVQHLSLEKLL